MGRVTQARHYNELTELEQSVQLARRKEIYEGLHPETKAGVAGALVSNRHTGSLVNDTVSFTSDSAAKVGQSKRTVERKVQIGEALSHVCERLAIALP